MSFNCPDISSRFYIQWQERFSIEAMQIETPLREFHSDAIKIYSRHILIPACESAVRS